LGKGGFAKCYEFV
jgi:polo-like kinase 1